MAAFFETLIKYLFYAIGQEFGFWNVMIPLGIIIGLLWLLLWLLPDKQKEGEIKTGTGKKDDQAEYEARRTQAKTEWQAWKEEAEAKQKAWQQAEQPKYEHSRQGNAERKAQQQRDQERRREKQVNLKMSLEQAYSLLGLEEGATKEQIKMAYRKNVKQCHPDLFVEDEFKEIAEEEIKRLNEAYGILSK